MTDQLLSKLSINFQSVDYPLPFLKRNNRHIFAIGSNIISRLVSRTAEGSINRKRKDFATASFMNRFVSFTKTAIKKRILMASIDKKGGRWALTSEKFLLLLMCFPDWSLDLGLTRQLLSEVERVVESSDINEEDKKYFLSSVKEFLEVVKTAEYKQSLIRQAITIWRSKSVLYILDFGVDGGSFGVYVGGTMTTLGLRLTEHSAKSTRFSLIGAVLVPTSERNMPDFLSLTNGSILEYQFHAMLARRLGIPRIQISNCGESGFEVNLGDGVSIHDLLNTFLSSSLYNPHGNLKPVDDDVLETLSLLYGNGRFIKNISKLSKVEQDFVKFNKWGSP